MRLLDKQHIAGAVSVIVAVLLVAWGLVTYRRHVQAEHAFAFVRDLAAFSEAHGHLPSSIQEFCQWKTDAKGQAVWDAETTARKIRFLWLSPDYAVTDNRHFLAILDPSIAKYETALNEQLVGLIPSNILRRILPVDDSPSLRR
jgi:hypothetical protein